MIHNPIILLYYTILYTRHRVLYRYSGIVDEPGTCVSPFNFINSPTRLTVAKRHKNVLYSS